MLNAFKRRFRTILQRFILLAILGAIFMLVVSYMNLEFCYKIMSQNSLTYMVSTTKICAERWMSFDTFDAFASIPV